MSTYETVLFLRAEEHKPDLEEDVHVAVDIFGRDVRLGVGDVMLPDAYLTPQQARDVAAALMKAADTCDDREGSAEEWAGPYG